VARGHKAADFNTSETTRRKDGSTMNAGAVALREASVGARLAHET